MNNSLSPSRRPKHILAVGAASLLAIFATTNTASAGSLTFSGVQITENFDLLGTGGLTTGSLTGNATNDGTSPWFVGVAAGGTGGTTQAAYTTQTLTSVSDGSVAIVNPGARLFNNGQTGVNANTDRSLGTGNTGGDPVIDLSLTNNSGATIDAFSITFDTEFWRGGVAATPAVSFGYQLFFSPTGLASTWTAFTGTQVQHAAFASGADLDGNDPANLVAATTRVFAVPGSIAIGQTFFIRFVDNNDATNSPDANIAIDNFSFARAIVPLNLTYNASHTVGGAPNGVIQLSADQYWLNGANPVGFAVNDNLTFSQDATATISVPTSVTAGTLTFSNAVGLYTIDTPNGVTLTATSLNGAAPFKKSGPGTLLLTATGTATGGLTIEGGTYSGVSSSAVGAATQNVNISNNATLQFTNTLAAASEFNNAAATTRTLTIGAGGATIDITGSTGATASGVTINRADSVIASEPITKAGGGVFRMAQNQALLSSNWIVNAGTLEASTAGALGSGNVTVNPNGTIVALGTVAGLVLPNNITLAGGTMGTKSGNLATFGGTVNVTAPSTMLARSNSTPANGQSFAISGLLTGSGAVNIPGATPLAADDLGTVTLMNPGNTYSGNFTVTSLQTLASVPSGGIGNTLGTAGVTLAGGTLQIRDDGTGNDGTLAYGTNVSVIAGTDATLPGVATLNLDRSAIGLSTGNTVAFGTLAIGNQTLNVTGANGYKARFTGATTLSGDATFDVVGSQLNLSGSISGAFGITKTGNGRLALDGTNNYTGPTTVNAGILGGIGNVPGLLTVNSGGILAPGGSPGNGVLAVGGDLTLNAGSTLSLDLTLAGLPGINYDRLTVGTGGPVASTGAITLNGGDLVLTLGAGIQNGDTFFVVLNDGIDPISGTFNGLSEGAQFTASGQAFTITYAANGELGVPAGGNDIALTAVPEPTGALLSLLGGAGLILRRRRR